MPPKKRKITVSSRCAFWPCGTCRRDCSVNSIYCDSCATWFHFACESFTDDDILVLTSDRIKTYTCQSCFRGEVGTPYSYSAAMLRISQATEKGVDYLTFQCKRESSLLPSFDVCQAIDPILQDVHGPSLDIMRQCSIENLGLPLKSLSDGNCLFSSASIALTGNNSLATEIRVRTCIEMLVNKELYTNLPNSRDILMTSPSFDDSCLDCGTSHGFSSQWTIYALSNAVKSTINVVYPPMNGPDDFVHRVLNTTCSPRDATHKTFTIMWTSCAGTIPNNRTWSSNHFVPLIVDSEQNLNFTSNSNSKHKESKLDDLNDMNDTIKTPIHLHVPNRHGEANNERFDREELQMTSSPIKLHEESDLSDVRDETSETSAYLKTANRPSGDENNGRFMDTHSLINILTHQEHDQVYDLIPRGIKENVGFIVRNDTNENREKNGRQRKYVDDCGVWGKVSLKSHYFLYCEGSFNYVDFKDNTFSKVVQKKRIPIDPQPKPEDVLLIKRAHTKLKREQNYQRRISWIANKPQFLKEAGSLAYVEYIGTFPASISIHGNNKNGHGEYVRTNADVVENIKSKVKQQKPREIYTELALEDSLNAPRDIKQIQNIKYTEDKKARYPNPKRSNNADDVQALLSLQHGHPFIKEIVQLSGKPPCVVVYTDEQLHDIKNFCSAESQNIIGIDRTFNLGAVYVTLTVYHNHNVLRKITQNPPIMLGPAYLHWDGSYNTYHRFFSHLQCHLDDISGTEISGKNLVFGSDEEKAMTKAIRKCFPQSTHMLCTRHIEENFKRQLRKIVGEKDRMYQTVISDVFGSDGLLVTSDDVEIDLKAMELEEKYKAEFSPFSKYFEDHIQTLKSFVWGPTNKKIVPINWTNNACESMNNLLKLSTNWKTLKLPELVDKLHKIVQLQYTDIRRALHGQGNYVLAPWTRKLQVRQITWEAKTEEEKTALMKKLLKFSKNKETQIKSSDGQLIIPKTPTTARKPNQKKRVRSNRTTTLKY